MSEQAELLYQNHTDAGQVEVRLQQSLCSLYINNIEQSRIDIKHQAELVLPVHRALLACLMFIETPQKVLLGGLGGGALARYLHSIFPQAQGDAVEISRDIAGLCQQFFDFPKQGWEIHVMDILQWQGAAYDLMVVDIAEGDATPGWLVSEPSLQHFGQQLSPDGVLVLDILVDNVQQLSDILRRLRKQFDRRTLCLTVPGHKNIVLMAFNEQPAVSGREAIYRRCHQISGQYNVDFVALFEQLQKDNPPGNGFF